MSSLLVSRFNVIYLLIAMFALMGCSPSPDKILKDVDAMISANRWGDVEKTLQNGIRQHPGNTELQAALAGYYVDAGRLDEAYRYLEVQGSRWAPATRAHLYSLIGQDFLRIGRVNEGLRSLHASLVASDLMEEKDVDRCSRYMDALGMLLDRSPQASNWKARANIALIDFSKNDACEGPNKERFVEAH